MKRRALLLAVAAAGLASACASSGTPYQPMSDKSRYGYAEQTVESNRVRITFAGDSNTDRKKAESYLLYRAAETTLARGYDWFVVVAHDVDEHAHFEASSPIRSRIGGGRVREESSPEAMADIVMHKGAKPAANPNAYDAREVQRSLAPIIVRPSGA